MAKRNIFVIITMIICIIMVGCGEKSSDDSTKAIETEGNNNVSQFEFKYKELSDISPMYYNSVIEYSDEYTSAPLYEWSEDVVLPIPMPEGAVQKTTLMPYDNVVFGDVDYDSWNEYVDMLKEKYDVISEDTETNHLMIKDDTYNFYVSMYFEEEILLENDDKTSGVVLFCYMGNQEINPYITKDEVFKIVCEELDVDEDNEDYIMYDVSSHSNINDGYWVYYLVSSNDTYLAIFNEKNMVGLLKNHAFIPLYKVNVEFVVNSEQVLMYVLTNDIIESYPMLTDFGSAVIKKYTLEDGKFKLMNSVYASDIEGCKDVRNIMMKKNNNNVIEIYGLLLNEDAESVPYNENWSVGDKIATYE